MSSKAEAREEGDDVSNDSIEESVAKLDRQLQRAAAAANGLPETPGAIKGYIANWIVPLLKDIAGLGVAGAAMGSTANGTATYALETVQRTISGEALVELQELYETLEADTLTQLPADHSINVTVANMREVFVRLGMLEDAVETGVVETGADETNDQPDEPATPSNVVAFVAPVPDTVTEPPVE